MSGPDLWNLLSRFEYYPRDTTADILLREAKTSYDLCRLREIAIHPNTPLEALLLLATDDLFARFPYKRLDYEWSSACDVMMDIFRNLGTRPGIPRELAEALWEKESKHVRSSFCYGLIAMIRNLDTPEDILEKIYDVSDRYMREEFDERYEAVREAKQSA